MAGSYELDKDKEAKLQTTVTESRSIDSNPDGPSPDTYQPYRLYKRRFAGLFGLFVLNVVAAMGWPWFGPIANNASAEFGFSLDEVNWLGNIVCCVYIPAIVLIPWLVSTCGVQRCCYIAGLSLLLSAWIRYAGTAHSLSTSGAYALIIIGQFFSAIAQSIYQVLAPKYSESWFGLKGRTTATMVVGISNPIGGALGQLISPLASNTRQSILILGIISTAALPCLILIGDKPPTPPTHAAAQERRSLTSLFKDFFGNTKVEDGMTSREKFDFVIVVMVFGFFMAGVNTFSILSAQYLEPYGYSADTSGLMGAALLLAGIVAAIVTAPLFDRIFTRHLALTARILVPIMAGLWLSLIWVVRPNETGALFAVFAIIGACSITLLPIALELGVELTRAADASSALLWGTGNLITVMFILSESALRAGPDASPPLNMHKAFILQAAFLCVAALLLVPLKGEQKRRAQDEILMVQRVEEPTVQV